MADKYKDYLAARVLADNKPVTYRLLSRAVKVNVHVAKQMLYDFHAKQNAKKPESVHATYILTGRKRRHEHTNGVNGQDDAGNSFMHSSPYMSSMPEREEPAEELIKKTSIVLVKEEELDSTRTQFEEITSVHIYSLEPGPIENLDLLSVCNSEVTTAQSSEDPLQRWKLYGSIHNPYVKRRTTKFVPAPANASTTAKPAPPKSKTSGPSKTIEPEKPAPPRRGSASEGPDSGRSTPQPTSVLKKSDSKSNFKREKSDLFKSFAKAKPKAKEAEQSKAAAPAPTEDQPMQGMSEDEGDGDDTPEVEFDEQKAAEARKARAEREEKLRKMMEDDDDEDMPDAPLVEEKESQDSTTDIVDTKPAGAESTVTVQGGRRRGRRKVMKKKKVKDEDGYLVTKEEAVWESFSEDEPEPKKPKPAPKPAVSTVKGKKATKPGQGSIANFFKKA